MTDRIAMSVNQLDTGCLARVTGDDGVDGAFGEVEDQTGPVGAQGSLFGGIAAATGPDQRAGIVRRWPTRSVPVS